MMRGKGLLNWLSSLRRLLAILGGLAVLVVTIAWLSGMFEAKIDPGRTDRGIRTYRGQPTDVVHEIEKPYVEEAIGTLKASSRTIVSAKILATIKDILVSAGDQVEKGQDLVYLESKEFEARLDQSKRVLEAATASRTEAEKQFKRFQSLVKQNAASQSEFDTAVRNLQVAIANEARAQQSVSEAEAQLSYTTIKAAKSGRIVDRSWPL